MYIDKDYLERVRFQIREVPWRCNDADLLSLLHFTESLVIDYERLKKEHSELLTNYVQHGGILRNQLITSMLNKRQIPIKDIPDLK